jgi:hypothetical protein
MIFCFVAGTIRADPDIEPFGATPPKGVSLPSTAGGGRSTLRALNVALLADVDAPARVAAFDGAVCTTDDARLFRMAAPMRTLLALAAGDAAPEPTRSRAGSRRI